jgi:hypothetical protein
MLLTAIVRNWSKRGSEGGRGTVFRYLGVVDAGTAQATQEQCEIDGDV